MKILCVQPRQLGDVLMTTPSLFALKKSLPRSRITFFTERRCACIIANNPDVDEVLCPEDFPFLRLIRVLRSHRFDVGIDFMGIPATARLLFFSGAALRIGFAKRGRSFFYNRRVAPQPERTYSAKAKAALLAPLKVSCPSLGARFFETESEKQEARSLIQRFSLDARKNVVALSPVSRRDYKRWPLSSFAAACDALHDRHGLVFLPLFGPGEEGFIREMIGLSGKKDIFLHPYEPISFGALKSVLEKCLIYFGNDNGIRHMAIAAGIPTAAIFGRPDPLNWTPPGSGRHFFLWGKEDLPSIRTEEALEIVEQALQVVRGIKDA